MRGRKSAGKTREPEQNLGVQLSDEELEYVMGGLSRVWMPFTASHTDVASPAPRQDAVAVVDATASKL